MNIGQLKELIKDMPDDLDILGMIPVMEDTSILAGLSFIEIVGENDTHHAEISLIIYDCINQHRKDCQERTKL